MTPEQEQKNLDMKIDNLISEFTSLKHPPKTPTEIDFYNIFLEKIRHLTDKEFNLYQTRFYIKIYNV
jgi:hypothetical protein